MNDENSLKDLCKNTFFICTMLALSSLYFIVTGIQFWVSDYMREVMGLSDAEVFTSYAII